MKHAIDDTCIPLPYPTVWKSVILQLYLYITHSSTIRAKKTLRLKFTCVYYFGIYFQTTKFSDTRHFESKILQSKLSVTLYESCLFNQTHRRLISNLTFSCDIIFNYANANSLQEETLKCCVSLNSIETACNYTSQIGFSPFRDCKLGMLQVWVKAIPQK